MVSWTGLSLYLFVVDAMGRKVSLFRSIVFGRFRVLDVKGQRGRPNCHSIRFQYDTTPDKHKAEKIGVHVSDSGRSKRGEWNTKRHTDREVW